MNQITASRPQRQKSMGFIREATLDDLEALLVIESQCFEYDRLSRRSFRYLLSKGKAETLVYINNGHIRGYSMVLFNSGTSLARLYSLAVVGNLRGKGVGQSLISASEHAALDRGIAILRLEVRPDSKAAIHLYEKAKFKIIGTAPDYYEDGSDALRYEKRLSPPKRLELAKVEYYQQSLEFTCGPAALMMAMHALRPAVKPTQSLELRLWRETTTIFMTSGHGGCGPLGMALAAYRRGFDVELFLSESRPFLVGSVRSEEKKAVIRIVHEDFLSELALTPINVNYRMFNINDIERNFSKNSIPIVLISSFRIYHEKAPHWVVVTGFDDLFVYFHDPYVDEELGKAAIDSMNIPVPRRDFEVMARYGKSSHKALVVLTKRGAKS